METGALSYMCTDVVLYLRARKYISDMSEGSETSPHFRFQCSCRILDSRRENSNADIPLAEKSIKVP